MFNGSHYHAWSGSLGQQRVSGSELEYGIETLVPVAIYAVVVKTTIVLCRRSLSGPVWAMQHGHGPCPDGIIGRPSFWARLLLGPSGIFADQGQRFFFSS
jgi:hypothetical protein